MNTETLPPNPRPGTKSLAAYFDRETLRRVRERLRFRGCRRWYHLDRWDCPGCADTSLRLAVEADGAVRLRCARGCSELELQRLLGVTGLDLGPLHLRPRLPL